MLVKETQVITSPHAPSKPWLGRFVSSSPRGLWNILNFHLHYSVTNQSGRLFPTTFVSPQPKTEPRWSEYSNRKKRTTWRKPILLEYWWILQIVFPAYRFVWSKCSTNNGILNAIGRAKCSQKKNFDPISFSIASPHFKSPQILYHSPNKNNRRQKAMEQFPTCRYYIFFTF